MRSCDLSKRLLTVVAVMTIFVASCSGSDTTVSTLSSAAPTSDTTPSEPDATSDTVADTTDSTDSDIRATLGVPLVTLLTPESGGGSRPELAWDAVDGAFFYSIVLFDPTGGAYWGWEGTTTAVHVGGEPVINEGLSGPSVIDGMAWQVAAYDADQNLIALSDRQPVAP